MVKDHETRWEEKAQNMLELLNKSTLTDEQKEKIEDDIYSDVHYSIDEFKLFLEKLENE